MAENVKILISAEDKASKEIDKIRKSTDKFS